MDTQIVEWQTMWQEQKLNTLESNELIKRLNSIERKAKIKRVVILILATILIITSVIRLSEILSNGYYLVSYIMIFAAIAMKLIPLYKAKYGMITDLSDLSNRNFIEKLNQKANYSIKHLLIWMSIIIIALNITLLGLYKKGTIFNYEITDENRIFFHLATIVLFLLAYFHNKRNLDKTKRKVVKLLSDIQSHKNEL